MSVSETVKPKEPNADARPYNFRQRGRENSMSLRSRRKKIAPGKRSETKWSEAPPGVAQQRDFQAHFSGRQNNASYNALSPPLHPGLTSAARFAGSLCAVTL